jgi:hypothetical protein
MAALSEGVWTLSVDKGAEVVTANGADGAHLEAEK